MSRIGSKAIEIPKGVQVTITPTEVTAKGPKGTHRVQRHPAIAIEQAAGTLVFKRSSDDKPARALHGLMRALVNNLIEGVTKGWTRELEINGVGYRAEVKGGNVVFQLGYSHPVDFKLPKGVSATIDKNVHTQSGIDKEAVGAAAAKCRSFRPPEPYKGKGVKYMEETILRKAGKAAGK
jgi:large subunit ribosomal protein L6